MTDSSADIAMSYGVKKKNIRYFFFVDAVPSWFTVILWLDKIQRKYFFFSIFVQRSDDIFWYFNARIMPPHTLWQLLHYKRQYLLLILSTCFTVRRLLHLFSFSCDGDDNVQPNQICKHVNLSFFLSHRLADKCFLKKIASWWAQKCC